MKCCCRHVETPGVKMVMTEQPVQSVQVERRVLKVSQEMAKQASVVNAGCLVDDANGRDGGKGADWCSRCRWNTGRAPGCRRHGLMHLREFAVDRTLREGLRLANRTSHYVFSKKVVSVRCGLQKMSSVASAEPKDDLDCGLIPCS